MEILFDYLRDVIYYPEKAELKIEQLPEDIQEFAKGLLFYTECVTQTLELAQALSRGELAPRLPSRRNEIAAPLKSLHASLKYLTWQAQQIAKGDYSQRVAFMGEFSTSFNTMIEQLDERQKKLHSKIKQIKKKSKSLEQSNLLFSSMIQHVPQQIIVIDNETYEILHMNDIARKEVYKNANYIQNILNKLPNENAANALTDISISYKHGESVHHLNVSAYFLEWRKKNAKILVIRDISEEKTKMEELENHAYRDSLTQLFNRAYGMLKMDSWLNEKRKFSVIFVDLDGLKRINDEFGHYDGDAYIVNASKHLKTFYSLVEPDTKITSSDIIVCRIGGDEFMVLVSDLSYNEVNTIMTKIHDNTKYEDFLKDKSYSYSISYGIASVDADNKLPASDILSIADERMYENKRLRKKERLN